MTRSKIRNSSRHSLLLKRIARLLYRLLGRVVSATSRTDSAKVVLISYYGQGYSCNPKYIAEALNRLFPGECELILLVGQQNHDIPAYVKQVPYRGYRALKELATARIWIDNCRGPKHLPKRKDQVYIQTWHASFGPKVAEKDAIDKLSPDYVENAKRDGAITDLMFSDNDYQERLYSQSFWYGGPVIRCGVPRNRILIHPAEDVVARVRSQIGLPKDSKLCLYAPTFRSRGSIEKCGFDVEKCVKALEKRFGGRFVLAFRLHPNMSKCGRPSYLSNSIDVTDYEDAQELLAAADVVISDYSSILDDFSLTARPGFVFAPDIDEYEDERGLYYPLRCRPFPVAKSQEELLEAIRCYDTTRSAVARDAYFQMLGLDEDGYGDEIIARIVRDLSVEGSTLCEALARCVPSFYEDHLFDGI